jgi:2'-5' RNA ligase
MALVGLKIPAEVSRLLVNIDVPGKRDKSDHLTMLYIEDDLSPNVVAKICKVMPGLLDKHKPFEAFIKKITCFSKGDDGVPIIGEVVSDELIKLRSDLADLFDEEKIKYSKKFPDFNPHVCLSYNKTKFKNIKLPTPIKWMVTEVIIWCGSESDNGIVVSFPLYSKSSNAILMLADSFSKIANYV